MLFNMREKPGAIFFGVEAFVLAMDQWLWYTAAMKTMQR